VTLTWVANPVTMPILFYFNYRLGAWLLRVTLGAFALQWNWAWVLDWIAAVWASLLLGSLVSASVAAQLGFFATRVCWGLRVMRAWRPRR
jgi:uncharacterized protein (DUF2062 family)